MANSKRTASVRTACSNLWMTGGAPPRHAVCLGELVEAMETIAPTHLAESWDNVGLLSGSPDRKIRRVLFTIDITPAVRDEAVRRGVDLVFSYHPPLFKPLARLATSGAEAPALAVELASYGIWVYAPHTAMDTVDGGTNDVLAQKVGATVTGSFSHYPAKGTYLKLVTFIPENDVERVADALFAAGCGHIGAKSKYTCCSFRTPGTGTFFGDDATHPAVGQRGQLERVHEIRFETILPAQVAGDVVSALRKSHPYEEPAFDLLKMETPPEEVGLGRYAALRPPLSLAAFARRCKRALNVPYATLVGDPDRTITTLAIVAGSCGRLPLDQAHKPYDCVLTGEIKHHHMLAYAASGIAVVALGHGNTERPVLTAVRNRLAKHFPMLDLRLSTADRDPFAIV